MAASERYLPPRAIHSGIIARPLPRARCAPRTPRRFPPHPAWSKP